MARYAHSSGRTTDRAVMRLGVAGRARGTANRSDAGLNTKGTLGRFADHRCGCGCKRSVRSRNPDGLRDDCRRRLAERAAAKQPTPRHLCGCGCGRKVGSRSKDRLRSDCRQQQVVEKWIETARAQRIRIVV